jgi:hypothetical protein
MILTDIPPSVLLKLNDFISRGIRPTMGEGFDEGGVQ